MKKTSTKYLQEYVKAALNQNGIEAIAYRNIKHCFENLTGEWYNCIQDGCPEYIPDSLEEAKQIIYEESLVNKYDEGYCGSGKAPREMRFAGTKFVRDSIDKLFDEDEYGDVAVLAKEKGWNSNDEIQACGDVEASEEISAEVFDQLVDAYRDSGLGWSRIVAELKADYGLDLAKEVADTVCYERKYKSTNASSRTFTKYPSSYVRATEFWSTSVNTLDDVRVEIDKAIEAGVILEDIEDYLSELVDKGKITTDEYQQLLGEYAQI